MRFRIKIQVWYSGLGFKFGIQVSESSLGCRVWHSGLRFRIDIQVWNKICTPGIFARENASSPFMMSCGILQKMLRTHI